MDIERCLRERDGWKIRVRYQGQPVNVCVSGDDIGRLTRGENPSEAHVVEALRGKHAALESAVRSAVLCEDAPPAEFPSLQIVRG